MTKKTRMFDLYSRNLEAVKLDPRVHLEPDISSIIICPQCFRGIDRDDLELTESPFSIEHVPPAALGGSIKTFTCRGCNSWAGFNLDIDLIQYIQNQDFLEQIPGSTVDAKITVGDSPEINAELKFSEEGILKILTSPERNNPKYLEQANQMLTGGPLIHAKFCGRRGQSIRQRRWEAALLRIAYLYAFSVFGYGFLISFGSQAIRSQFKQPDQNILPFWGISRNQSLPDSTVGINLIKSPSELRSFLVVFDLNSGLRSLRFSVLLPGPTTPGVNIYQYLSTQEKDEFSIPITLAPIPNDYNYLDDPKAAFAFHDIWKSVS